MLFHRSEPKRRRGTCTLLVGALTTIGACTVVSLVRQRMSDMANGMKDVLCVRKGRRDKRTPPCEGDGAGADPS